MSSGMPFGTAHPRVVGAAMGFAIAAVLCAFVAMIDAVSANANLPTVGLPTMAAGTMGGALLGPRSVRTPWTATWRSRFGLRIRLAFAAIVIGAFVVGQEIGLGSYLDADGDASLMGNMFGGLLMAPIGILFYGPFALPFTYAAALIWSWLMRRVAPPPRR